MIKFSSAANDVWYLSRSISLQEIVIIHLFQAFWRDSVPVISTYSRVEQITLILYLVCYRSFIFFLNSSASTPIWPPASLPSF